MADSISTKNPATQTATVAKTNTTAVKPKNPKDILFEQISISENYLNEGLSSEGDNFSFGGTIGRNLFLGPLGTVSAFQEVSQHYDKKGNYRQALKELAELRTQIAKGEISLENAKIKLQEIDQKLIQKQDTIRQYTVDAANAKAVGAGIVAVGAGIGVAVLAPQVAAGLLLGVEVTGITITTAGIVATTTAGTQITLTAAQATSFLALTGAITTGYSATTQVVTEGVNGNLNKPETWKAIVGQALIEGTVNVAFLGLEPFGKLMNPKIVKTLGIMGVSPNVATKVAPLVSDLTFFTGIGITSGTAEYYLTLALNPSLTAEEKQKLMNEKGVQIMASALLGVGFRAVLRGVSKNGDSARTTLTASQKELKPDDANDLNNLVIQIIKKADLNDSSQKPLIQALNSVRDKLKNNNSIALDDLTFIIQQSNKHGLEKEVNQLIQKIDPSLAKLITIAQKLEKRTITSDDVIELENLAKNSGVPESEITEVKALVTTTNPASSASGLVKAPATHLERTLNGLTPQQESKLGELSPAQMERFNGIIQSNINNRITLGEENPVIKQEVIDSALNMAKSGSEVPLSMTMMAGGTGQPMTISLGSRTNLPIYKLPPENGNSVFEIVDGQNTIIVETDLQTLVINSIKDQFGNEILDTDVRKGLIKAFFLIPANQQGLIALPVTAIPTPTTIISSPPLQQPTGTVFSVDDFIQQNIGDLTNQQIDALNQLKATNEIENIVLLDDEENFTKEVLVFYKSLDGNGTRLLVKTLDEKGTLVEGNYDFKALPESAGISPQVINEPTVITEKDRLAAGKIFNPQPLSTPEELARQPDIIQIMAKVGKNTTIGRALNQYKQSRPNDYIVNLSQTSLISADFRGSTLENVDLTGANLTGADFSNANLKNTNFQNVRLKVGNFQYRINTKFFGGYEIQTARQGQWETSTDSTQNLEFLNQFERLISVAPNWKEALFGDVEIVVPLNQLKTENQLPKPTGTVINPANQAPAQTVGTSTNKTAVASSIITPVENKAIPVIQKGIKYNLKTNVSPNSPVEGNSDIQKLQNAPVVTIGDLHANPRKLIETLVMSNLVTMTEQDAEQLIKLFEELDAIPYEGYSYSDDNLVKVKNIYSQIQAIIKDIEWVGGNRQIVVGGDEIADRGHFDQVVMDIIQHINGDKANSKIIVIASNHSYVGRNFDASRVIQGGSASSQARSFQVADDVEALKARYTEHIANQKLMVYNPKTKTLYAHAMITPANIKQLIQKMEEFGYLPAGVTKYEDINENNLASFIDKANEFYHDYILEIGNFAGKDLSAVDEIFQECGEGRVGGLVWGEDPYENVLQLPFHNKGVSTLVHGHGDKSKSSPYEISNNNPDFTIVNLNQQIGKGSNTGAGQDNPLFVENDLIDLPATATPPKTLGDIVRSNWEKSQNISSLNDFKNAQRETWSDLAQWSNQNPVKFKQVQRIVRLVGVGLLLATGGLALYKLLNDNKVKPEDLAKLSDGELNALMVKLAGDITLSDGAIVSPALIENGEDLYERTSTSNIQLGNKKVITLSITNGKYSGLSNASNLSDTELNDLMVALAGNITLSDGAIVSPVLIEKGEDLYERTSTSNIQLGSKVITLSITNGKYSGLSIK